MTVLTIVGWNQFHSGMCVFTDGEKDIAHKARVFDFTEFAKILNTTQLISQSYIRTQGYIDILWKYCLTLGAHWLTRFRQRWQSESHFCSYSIELFQTCRIKKPPCQLPQLFSVFPDCTGNGEHVKYNFKVRSEGERRMLIAWF